MESRALGSIASLEDNQSRELTHRKSREKDKAQSLTLVTDSVWQDTADTNTNNMSRREDKFFTNFLSLFISLIDDLRNLIQRHS